MPRYDIQHDELCDMTTTTEYTYRYDLDTDEIIESANSYTDGGRTTDPVEVRRIALDDADEHEIREAAIAQQDGDEQVIDEWYDELIEQDDDELLADKRELLRRKSRAERDTQTFIDTYKPIPLDPKTPHYFERHFDDKEWREAGLKFVWTLIDTNGEGSFFVPGRHYVNRYAAVLCAVPWTDETIELAYD